MWCVRSVCGRKISDYFVALGAKTNSRRELVDAIYG